MTAPLLGALAVGATWVEDSITCKVADRTLYRGDLVNGSCGPHIERNPAGPQYDYVPIFRCTYFLNGPFGRSGNETRACVGDSVKAKGRARSASPPPPSGSSLAAGLCERLVMSRK